MSEKIMSLPKGCWRDGGYVVCTHQTWESLLKLADQLATAAELCIEDAYCNEYEEAVVDHYVFEDMENCLVKFRKALDSEN